MGSTSRLCERLFDKVTKSQCDFFMRSKCRNRRTDFKASNVKVANSKSPPPPVSNGECHFNIGSVLAHNGSILAHSREQTL
jgi:hypothetical protein